MSHNTTLGFGTLDECVVANKDTKRRCVTVKLAQQLLTTLCADVVLESGPFGYLPTM